MVLQEMHQPPQYSNGHVLDQHITRMLALLTVHHSKQIESCCCHLLRVLPPDDDQRKVDVACHNPDRDKQNKHADTDGFLLSTPGW